MPESVDSSPASSADSGPGPSTGGGMDSPTPAAPRWDVFCRVIDNHGDLGVCLRLARDLAFRGLQVRLWCDDLSALHWMGPSALPGLEVRLWNDSLDASPADVVIEAFGCDLPPGYLAAMAARAAQGTAPVWINLEYLSAEPYVERSHGLHSPQFSGPGKGLGKWFFYPGFTARTGGLLREPLLAQAVAAHDGPAWLAARGWAPQPGEQVLSLFAYPHAPWELLLDALPGRWLLLLCPGAAQQAVPPLLRPGQRAMALPYLSQADYDRLLWSCDLNLVRGEDSFVRAQWAGQPMLWQIYHQDDGAHGPKLEAYLALAWAGAPPGLSSDWRALNQAWNGLALPHRVAPPAPAPSDGTPQPSAAARDALSPVPIGRQALSALPAAREQAARWRAKLMEHPDLATQLMAFALGKAGVSG